MLDLFLEQLTDKIIRIRAKSDCKSLGYYNLGQHCNRAIKESEDGPYKQSNFPYFFTRMKEVVIEMEITKFFTFIYFLNF